MPNIDWLITGARVLTLFDGHANREHARCGASEMRHLGVIDRADVAIAGGRVVDIRPMDMEPEASSGAPALTAPPDRIIAANGRVLMPGFVDCHTHACWGGDRLDEFQMKLEGATYLDLLKAGGGIMSTVRATRAASEEELVESLVARVERMITLGSTTVEVKSGYGLDTETELKMLRAIDRARGQTPASLVPTALIAHAIDRDAESPDAFFDRTISETLPAVAREFPGITIDAYCEDGAWPLEAT
ncbi:MAG: imidazolonepropionase, partial [Planctomycetota bacterium]